MKKETKPFMSYKKESTTPVKVNRQNKPIRLSDTEKAYRSGYLAAQKDSRRAYKSRQNRNMPIIYIGD